APGFKARMLGLRGWYILAPMPGLVVDILISEGQQVTAGDTLIVLEAMKLMQKLVAPATGTVSKIHYSIGDTPEKGAILLSIDIEEKAA
ncbi:MAG: acetyl-CoA carboxylase biotin carboxyl carrier protein subunit, partial [Sneathiella sp.]|nr:acetyl-CoA carboxylase biotin carboxyl carrier protein subunit [Sneathiella sp.]